ncbi:MAG: YajQ family cyclic di-GMP-binding protein [Campylobacteraceae bacterium]
MAAKEHSFDISAELNIQEFKNALEQTKKEITSRFDFKGVLAELDYNEKAKTLTITSSSDSKVEAIFDMMTSKAIKRGLSPSILKESKKESASGGNARIVYSIVDTISSDDAKKIVKIIKDEGLKVQASIRGDVVRVVGKSIDDLQVCIKTIREKELGLPISFTNLK